MRKRLLEIVLILAVVAAIPLAWPPAEKPPAEPPATLRLSVQGGSGHEAYFFELRGQDWQAVLAGPGSGSRRLRGLLSEAEVNDLFGEVESCPAVWKTAQEESVWFGSGPRYPFYCERSGRIAHRRDLIRSSLSEQQLVAKLTASWPGKVRSSLEHMRSPAGSWYAPPLGWPWAALDAGGPRGDLY